MGDTEETKIKTVEHSIPIDILNDLVTRFLICVPESAKQNLIRICFQIEAAHWFYLDFYVKEGSQLKACSIYEFAAHVFQHVPYLKSEYPNLNNILAEWKEYKQSVPTYGAIIISEGLNHVLLVQSYWAKPSWGFPKGKVNEEEDPVHCAVREVQEETSFDISNYIKPKEYFESIVNDQLVRLYIVKNVPLNTEFQPKTRCEIKACKWFLISDLPNNKKDVKLQNGLKTSAFYMVIPFVKRLKQLCNQELSTAKKQRSKSESYSYSEEKLNKSVAKLNLNQNQKCETDEFKLLKKRQERNGKGSSKRQLFTEDKKIEFCAPSWLNFKFNRTAIMECMP